MKGLEPPRAPGLRQAATTYNLTTAQLVSETERLLSSLVASGQETLNDKEAMENTLAESKRQRRNQQAAVRRNRYRQRLKEEKQTLLQQEAQLQDQLRQLIQTARALANAGAFEKTALSVWRAVADRQLEKKLEAEQEQRELQAAISHYGRILHQMKALLPPSNQANGRLRADDSTRVCAGAAVIRSYLLELDSLYAQTDTVLASAELNVSPSLTYTPKRKVPNGLHYFEESESVTMPFPFAKVAHAMSIFFVSNSRGVRYDVGMHDRDDTTAGRFTADYRCHSGETADFVMYTATKRYREAYRVVFVCRILTEGQDAFAGSVTDETGWIVLRSVGGPGCPMTVCDSCTRLVPMSIDAVSNNKVRADRFTEIVIQSRDGVVKGLMKAIENMLIK